MQMQLAEIAKVTQGKLNGSNISITSISTDTRKIQANDLFIALKGPHFDANDFAAEAAKRGAAAAIVSRAVDLPIPTIQVTDTRMALGQLAASYRQQFQIPMIGLTGSAGKTTTKAMLASILQQCGNTLSTEGTMNNDIGVPLTLLRLRPEHQYAVIEMGANHPGEINYVAAIAKPTVALITNAGPAHLEGFIDLPGVAHAKGEIFQNLDPDGIAIINADDQFSEFWQGLNTQRRIIRFGRNNNTAEVTAKNLEFDANGFPQFILVTPSGEIAIKLQILGEHNVMNALAAAAATLALNIPLSAIKQGLEVFAPVNKRLVVKQGYAGAMIIDDSYNANPLSVTAAIHTLAKQPGEKILAFGDMRELGPQAQDFHVEIGKEAKRQGINHIYAYGELAAYTIKAFGIDGYHFPNQEELIAALRAHVNSNVTVLVKGSLSMKMSQVVAALLQA